MFGVVSFMHLFGWGRSASSKCAGSYVKLRAILSLPPAYYV